MSAAFTPQLVNPPFGDPGLYVLERHRGRALLFDLGELDGLSARALLKVTGAFVSHTHIDHFVGFDRLLRVRLAHARMLEVYGPPGILANVQGKLAGYTWNLTERYAFAVTVHEIAGEQIESTRLEARSGFLPQVVDIRGFDRIACEAADYTVRVDHLDHRVPCLGFALEEKRRLNVRPERLAESGLEPGAWLTRLKAAIRAGLPDETPVQLPGREPPTESLGYLRNELILERRGYKIAYVVDARFTATNVERIVDLARDADVFFCEAAFLDEDRELALSRYHLTARQAGTLARAAGADRLVTFHHSPRYGDDPAPFQDEAQRTFLGQLPPAEPL